jgi:hypothetical protein
MSWVTLPRKRGGSKLDSPVSSRASRPTAHRAGRYLYPCLRGVGMLEDEKLPAVGDVGVHALACLHQDSGGLRVLAQH